LSSGASKVKKNKKNNLFEDVVIDEPGKKSKKRQPVIIEAKNDAKYDFWHFYVFYVFLLNDNLINIFFT